MGCAAKSCSGRPVDDAVHWSFACRRRSAVSFRDYVLQVPSTGLRKLWQPVQDSVGCKSYNGQDYISILRCDTNLQTIPIMVMKISHLLIVSVSCPKNLPGNCVNYISTNITQPWSETQSIVVGGACWKCMDLNVHPYAYITTTNLIYDGCNYQLQIVLVFVNRANYATSREVLFLSYSSHCLCVGPIAYTPLYILGLWYQLDGKVYFLDGNNWNTWKEVSCSCSRGMFFFLCTHCRARSTVLFSPCRIDCFIFEYCWISVWKCM